MNTTFNALEAVKYMADGIVVKEITSNKAYWLENNTITYLAYGLKFSISLKNFLKMRKMKDDFCLADKNLKKYFYPKTIWRMHSIAPEPNHSKNGYCWMNENKRNLLGICSGDIKFLEWETKYFPETWEQCE